MTRTLSVEVWSDIACPWCYVGKRRLESALARFAQRSAVQVTWRAFELDRAAPAVLEPAVPYAERLAKKYGAGLPQARAMIDRMVAVGRAEGLSLDFDHIRPGNTFAAHRMLQLARQHGLADALEERLFCGYLSEGQAIGQQDVLIRLGAEVGLDVDQLVGLFAGDLFADDVRREQREAQALGISGVPFFLLDRRYAVEGAQPAELLLSALERAWSERPEPHEAAADDGAVCGVDGCESPG